MLLDWNDVFGLGTFLAVSDREFDFLTLGERLEAGTLNGAEVNKYIGTGFLLDKAKTLGLVKPLHSAFSCGHALVSLFASNNKPGPYQAFQLEVLRLLMTNTTRNKEHFEMEHK
jgi:hypothetical protein